MKNKWSNRLFVLIIEFIGKSKFLLMEAVVEFTGKLGKYKIIETEDQTKTIWSEFFNEACHNLSGAYNETIHNYILGCQIPEQINQQKRLNVLDVGFGVGIGLLALIDEYKKYTNLVIPEFSYTSIELDEELFLWSIQTNLSELTFEKKDQVYVSIFSCNGNSPLSITIYIGDGRQTLKAAQSELKLPPFTAIFQDAFSPKKNPALWSVEWFSDLKAMSDPNVFLSTYSSSISIRKSLLTSGWQIENAKGFGQKRTMTKARLIGSTDPVLLAELSRSPTLELRDN